MEHKKLIELEKGLLGITYSEWKQLKMIIDSTFEKKKSETERSIRLASLEDVREATQSLFECRPG